jgi:hypothetical protein
VYGYANQFRQASSPRLFSRVSGVVFVLCVVGALLAPASVLAGEGGCANEGSPGFRGYMADCRAYEVVTPAFKDGTALNTTGPLGRPISEDGSRIVGESLGTVAGSPNTEVSGFGVFGAYYELHRETSGWTIEALDPPAATFAEPLLLMMSGDLTRSLWRLTLGDTREFGVYLRTANGTFEGPIFQSKDFSGLGAVYGASSELARVFYTPTIPVEGLYEYVAASHQSRLVSNCASELGSGFMHSMYNAVSRDGSVVFFECGGELFARVNGTETVSISEPSAGDCGECLEGARAPAEFQGASADGSKAFFVTEQELLPGVTGRNIYEYDFDAAAGHSRIALVSGGGESARVLGMVRVSKDGSHVYFVAEGRLTGANMEGNEPLSGARNLYVYDTTTGSTMFVATLQSPAEEALLPARCTTLGQENAIAKKRGEEEIAAEKSIAQTTCLEAAGEAGFPATIDIWNATDARVAEASSDGLFLMFESLAHLTGDDTSTVPQVFEYDAQTQRLARVSIGEGGAYNEDGNTDNFAYAPVLKRLNFYETDSPAEEGSTRLLADNGSVFFQSSDSLTSQAVSGYPVRDPGFPNVYEYAGGEVSLVSDGSDASTFIGEPTVKLFGVDASGADVFFQTADALAPQDADTQVDWYDARADGGFPAPVTAGCVGGACQGPLSAAPGLASPGGSATQAAGEDVSSVTAPRPVVAPKPKAKKRKAGKPKAKHKKKRAKKAARRSAHIVGRGR